jgi:hypothetical protein
MKDDLVLNVNQSLNPAFTPRDAYPSVTSNFTSIKPRMQKIIADWYAKSSPVNFFEFQREIEEKRISGQGENEQNDDQYTTMPFFRAQGYALGRAEASCVVGDTVFSVLIGGQMTVTNGHFPMRPGQMVQWYFDFEQNRFDADGRRSQQATNDNRNINAPLAQRYHDQTSPESMHYALPKPYVLNKNGSDHYGDKIRIFAKCIAGGAPHNKVDIMLMTQSL